MNITVEAAHYKHLIIVVNRLGSEELLRFLQRTLLSFDLIGLCVETKAVRDPTLVPAKYQDLTFVQWEATNRVSRSPGAVF